MKYIFIFTLLFISCENSNHHSDAYGNFEAREITVSSESSGKILSFIAEEGATLDSGAMVAQIDTIPLTLKRKQLDAARMIVSSKTKNVVAQMNVLKEQLKNMNREKERVEKLLKDGAATTKQMDDISGNIQVLNKQIESIEVQNAPVLGELKSVESQIEQLQDQIMRCKIRNPKKGVVLSRFTEQGELAMPGKPLYKLAGMGEMFLRVYVSGNQLPNIKIGQTVSVMVDESRTTNKTLSGKVTWISSQSEFTPKIIQTKEERVNLVYAVKISVINDGSLKIGMPGEVNF
ncbi:MAG: ABC transporter [Bacteroidetes bacterium RIFCSPLOWO2_02_FULL_36_8]|nr:MAG: ABC transporter [Bacteroidetes bacterium RIFCSPLOWO2_02_FULL_36_8]OFY70425.1 MAG: ABC transporter [Bacteroidetes bacterium RIFCSPLOWO2_12_FULL_37_12]